jgi:hypothetical protein
MVRWTVNKTLVVFCIVYFISIQNYFGQTICETCVSGETIIENNQLGGGPGNPRIVTYNNNNNIGWANDAKPNSTSFAKFVNSGNFLWEIGGNNTVVLKGLIISSGVTLQIERTNANETPIFDIIGGCILVESNATLIFSYYTEMVDLTICVKSGGTLIFDSESPGQSDGDRDKFLFNNIEIIVESGSEIKFGNAEIEQSGSILIDGYIGNPCVLNGDGSFSPPPPYSPQSDVNIKIDIPPMNQEELNLFCRFLSAGTRIAPLPVEYIYFNSAFDLSNRNAKLSWATAKEWENSHFEIERSVNGTKSWEQIGKMEGRGWSDMPVVYEFVDEALPLVGGNLLYRLKQVDFNGSFAYSKVVSLKVPSLQLTKGVWRVYPNPTNGEKFRVELLNAKEYHGENIQIRLVTPIAGYKTLEGNNINEVSNQLEEIFKRVNKGVYVLEIFWGQKLEHIKVLKD